MLLMWNQFNIALISKFERPTSMRDLKPIALCNVNWKSRNKTIWEGKHQTSQGKFHYAKHFLDDWITARSVVNSSEPHISPQLLHCWVI